MHLDADAERGKGRVVGLYQGGAIVLGVCEGGDILTEPEPAELLADLNRAQRVRGIIKTHFSHFANGRKGPFSSLG